MWVLQGTEPHGRHIGTRQFCICNMCFSGICINRVEKVRWKLTWIDHRETRRDKHLGQQSFSFGGAIAKRERRADQRRRDGMWVLM